MSTGMAFVNPDTTYAQQADRVHGLYQRIGDIRDQYEYGDTDARLVNLNNAMMAANAATSTLRLMAWAKAGGDAVLIRALGLTKPEYINLVAEDLLRSSRLFLLIESQFQLESLFRCILLALGKAADRRGFHNIAKDVLAASGVPSAAEKLRILNVPALMRNSMHANGMHRGFRGMDTVQVIDGVEFRFEDGKRVQCGSWYHVVIGLSASFDILEEILEASPVKALEFVRDAYAEEAAAG